MIQPTTFPAAAAPSARTCNWSGSWLLPARIPPWSPQQSHRYHRARDELENAPAGPQARPRPAGRPYPFDQHALFFSSFDAMSRWIDEADQDGTPVLQMFEPRAEDANSRGRYQKQLCLELNALSRLIGPQAHRQCRLHWFRPVPADGQRPRGVIRNQLAGGAQSPAPGQASRRATGQSRRQIRQRRHRRRALHGRRLGGPLRFILSRSPGRCGAGLQLPCPTGTPHQRRQRQDPRPGVPG